MSDAQRDGMFPTRAETESRQKAMRQTGRKKAPGSATIYGQPHNCPTCKGLGSYVGVAGVFDECPVCNGTGDSPNAAGERTKTDPAVRRREIVEAISKELDRAYAKHGRDQWGRHEFYAILKEEVDELWEDIKKDAPMENLKKEAIQVAAMVFRYLETGDRKLEPEQSLFCARCGKPYKTNHPLRRLCDECV